MMTIDDITEYVACVNGGSGVIFQPVDEKYTYILTAKHVFDDIATDAYKGKVKVDYFQKASGNIESLPEFDLKEGDNYFPHTGEDIDIAIIKIGKVNAPNNIILTSNYFVENKDYFLVGYPEKRRDKAGLDMLRVDNNVNILQAKEFKRVEADIGKNQNWDELKGTSGGGIFKPSGDYLLLAGIQSQVPDSDEALGRIEFTPVKILDEIIESYNGSLEAIFPAYLKCFSFLKDEAFLLAVDMFDEGKIVFTRNYLKNKVSEVIQSGITPIAIKSFFENRLLVNENENQALFERKIWLVWLEFLTILNVIKYKKFGEKELVEIFSCFRLIYSDSAKEWTYLIRDELLYSDYRGLKPDSNVFVGSKTKPLGTLSIPRDKIRNIVKVYDKNRFKTDAGIHPYTHFNFIHVTYLERVCIIEKLEQYAAIEDEETLLEALKNQYNELFK
jgi:hypothetical protein